MYPGETTYNSKKALQKSMKKKEKRHVSIVILGKKYKIVGSL